MPSYTSIPKPTGSNYINLAKPGGVVIIRAGMTIGLNHAMPLTASRPISTQDTFTKINKPTGSGYTNIAKPVD